MKATEQEVKEIVKNVIANLENPDREKEQNEQQTLESYKKMGYKIVKPFKKVLPIRAGKKKGELKEYSGYVMKKTTHSFAKVFTTEKRDKLENVWA